MSFGDTSRRFSEWSRGIDLTLDDFDRIGSHVPLLVDLQPAGPIPHG
jgi:dihydroxyacid dehydratase/phosphogluconate dehydratase